MSIGPLASIAGGFLQSIFSTASQNGSVASPAASNSTTIAATPKSDSSQISPFAQVLSTLQHMQQTDPAQYQQVTQQISANLQSASNTAQANGNTSAAAELKTLATDFTNASQSGQLPNVQDLASAVTGGHHHHHDHAHLTDAAATSATASNAPGTPPASTNPMSIVQNTLSGAAA
jgi:hypothetical protein